VKNQNLIKKLTTVVLFSFLISLTTSCWIKQCPFRMLDKKPVDLIPREVLFGNPEKISARLSPDGIRIAYVAPYNNVLNVWIKTIGKDDESVVTKDNNRGIRNYFWAYDSKHIMFMQDVDGNEQFHIYGVNIENGNIIDYTPFENIRARVIGRNKYFPNELLIAMNKDNPKLHDVYHLDLISGELELEAKNQGNFGRWSIDTNLKVRGAEKPKPGGGYDLLVRKNENSEWEKIIEWDHNDSMTSHIVGFTKDGNHVYLVDSRNANAGRLIKMNLSTKEIEVIAEDPQYDVRHVMLHPDSYEVQAVLFLKERLEFVILDESIRADIEAIKKLDHGDFSIVNRDNDDDTWLISYQKDNGPVSYYSYERDTKVGKFLFNHRSDLNNYTLAPMEPYSFTSRDGLTIHGYITYPPKRVKKNLPMVLNVHGGPWGRDTWGYRSGAQWIANRGYICLQVNFRGSTGYGKDFVNAGDKEWGGKMHDDLVDAVNWAIDKGIADPDRIAIYGGSYGGYAALVGATFTPDLFSCAVDIVGPSNLITFLNTVPPYWSTFLPTIYRRVGNPKTEIEFLKSRSPLNKVDQIKIPMLIAQGANDPRVNQAESEQIVEAMKAKGIEYEYLLFEDEGHGFAKPENRLEFFAAAEKFLAKHLGGRYEEAKEE